MLSIPWLLASNEIFEAYPNLREKKEFVFRKDDFDDSLEPLDHIEDLNF